MSYLPAQISSWQLAEHRTRKGPYSFGEFGHEQISVNLGAQISMSPQADFD